MTAMRELLPPDELLKPRDGEPDMAVHPDTWLCPFCEPGTDGETVSTTVDWVGPQDGVDGRCRDCGQKFYFSDRVGEALP